MIHEKLINPASIVVIGASNNKQTPGGSVLNNLISHNFKGELFAVNPKETVVQGVKCYSQVSEIPNVDVAIIAIAAKFTLETIQLLATTKNTKGFIIFSAGFSEKDEDGAKLEQQIVTTINAVGGSLLGPNNIGLINQNYAGVFTTPIPKLNSKGVDFISGSGATAVFIIEAAAASGLTFSSIHTVGNSAQIGVEEVLEHLDEDFNEQSSKVKLLYIESISNPQKLLKHATSLIQKGCKIAAIKAGSSDEGSRAASSHTGALANSDVAVDALFKKAGIVRCYGRNELITVASIFLHPTLTGKNIAVITHAGGPAVMLTDALSKSGLNVPEIKGKVSEELLEKLFLGSSASNPIDFLATGNAEQLETIIDYCEHKFTEIDAMVVIFGSPGLFEVYDVYDVLNKKINSCSKPIFAILPSVVNVKNEIEHFISKGNIAFFDEVQFGNALGKIFNSTPISIPQEKNLSENYNEIREIIANCKEGYLDPNTVKQLLQAAKIPIVEEFVCTGVASCEKALKSINFPIVMKVIGPVHKSDVGGIVLNVESVHKMTESFYKLMKIKGATAVLLQPMKKGLELFIGAKRESNFGHLVLCGLGGIYIEVFKDIQARLAPISNDDALEMIRSLKSYKIIQGIRNQAGINENTFAEIITKISNLVSIAPEISELDLNPLLATSEEIIAVDARIYIEKN
ncbi:acetate--CoA ligase family protein [Lutibacter sp.]|uniref:acetate--CoA ligase family protein n=1 Tax=Lutibacter sp. TaxID=1925666 RepID=UPI0027348E52|nr:acetate--CoA ligase family protein [Lutibacter sp.]MDP3313733.1 acetate--CoA ligase family protein [Lutibacter sp.]